MRACATAAIDEPDFVARLREEGVVALARYAKGSETEPEPGALAAAARSLAGTATIRRPRGDQRRWHGAPARHTAELLLGARRARTSRGLVREVAFLSERLGEMHAAANEAQRAFELEVAANRQIEAVGRLELAPSPPQARPNLDGPRGPDADLER